MISFFTPFLQPQIVKMFSYCIHRIASGGYYGFCFVKPPLHCVERFHRYRSKEKNIIARLHKFAGSSHNHKILPGNIFCLILKNKMAATCVFSTFSKEFCWPSQICRVCSSLQNIDIGIFLASFSKTRWPPLVFLCQS